jgi:hypothetical protein
VEVNYAMDSDVCTANDERIFGISDGNPDWPKIERLNQLSTD